MVDVINGEVYIAKTIVAAKCSNLYKFKITYFRYFWPPTSIGRMCIGHDRYVWTAQCHFMMLFRFWLDEDCGLGKKLVFNKLL